MRFFVTAEVVAWRKLTQAARVTAPRRRRRSACCKPPLRRAMRLIKRDSGRRHRRRTKQRRERRQHRRSYRCCSTITRAVNTSNSSSCAADRLSRHLLMEHLQRDLRVPSDEQPIIVAPWDELRAQPFQRVDPNTLSVRVKVVLDRDIDDLIGPCVDLPSRACWKAVPNPSRLSRADCRTLPSGGIPRSRQTWRSGSPSDTRRQISAVSLTGRIGHWHFPAFVVIARARTAWDAHSSTFVTHQSRSSTTPIARST